jgi:hypothetical protein
MKEMLGLRWECRGWQWWHREGWTSDDDANERGGGGGGVVGGGALAWGGARVRRMRMIQIILVIVFE